MRFPVELDLDAPPEIDRWRPLVQWLLAIPHMIVAQALSYVAGAVSFFSWFIIVFTGALPPGIANFQCMVLRYTARAYSYSGFLREPYPEFEFEMTPQDPDTDPLKIDIAPELENRNRLTVGLRFLWILPAALWAVLLAIALSFAYLASFFVVLFTGRWSDGMRDFVLKLFRYFLWFNAYAYLLIDEYPPFTFDPFTPARDVPGAGGPQTRPAV
jgi:Domain of unknown function (DUF4389)